jgi:hypothetical protein
MSSAPDVLHAPSPSPPGAVVLPPELTLADLGRAAVPVTWLWHGYLAAGNVTLLTSQWKSDKTTLLSVLLAGLGAGGQLAGLAVAPARAVVVTEEHASRWYDRSRKLAFGDGHCWLCRPFRAKPRYEEWLALIDRLDDVRRRRGVALAVLDPLAEFLPGRDENSAGLMLEALLPLRRLTDAGLALLLLHHPSKEESADGCGGRGSSALLAFADILIEMHHYAAATDPETDRRRRLVARSRFDETPRRLVIELNADGTDYLAHGDLPDEEFVAGWAVLRSILEASPCKRTRREIQGQWPEQPVPGDATLWRLLQRALAHGLIRQDGTGRRSDPFHYWLAGQEEMWRADPLAQLLLQQQEAQRAAQARLGDVP